MTPSLPVQGPCSPMKPRELGLFMFPLAFSSSILLSEGPTQLFLQHSEGFCSPQTANSSTSFLRNSSKGPGTTCSVCPHAPFVSKPHPHLLVPLFCMDCFSWCYNTMTSKSSFKRMVILAPGSVMVRVGTAAKAGGGWSHGAHSQEKRK